MPGRWAARHIAKLDTASTTSPATTSAFSKKSSGDANMQRARMASTAPTAAARTRQVRPCESRSTRSRAPRSDQTAIAIVRTVAAPADRVSRRQSRSGPGEQQHEQRRERELGRIQAHRECAAAPRADPRRTPSTAASGSFGRRPNDERVRAGVRRTFELQPQRDRHDARLERELGARQRVAGPRAAAPRRRSRRYAAPARPDRRSVGRERAAGPGCFAPGTWTPGRTAGRRAHLPDRPSHATGWLVAPIDRDRHVGSRRAGRHLIEELPRRRRIAALGAPQRFGSSGDRAHRLIEPRGQRREFAFHLGPEPRARRREVAAKLRSARSRAPRPQSPRRPPGRPARCASPRA